jgi:anti-sigma B factor antagonist
MINITKESEDNIHIIKVEGDVDAASSIYLDKAISDALSRGQKRILIDCNQLDYISSAGLGVFMSYIQDFESSDSRFVLFGLSDRVAGVFEILGLDQLLTIVNSKEEALIRVSNEI